MSRYAARILTETAAAKSVVNAALPQRSLFSTVSKSNPTSAIRPSSHKPLRQQAASVAGPSHLALGQGTGARSFSASTARQHGDLVRPKPGTGIKVTFRDHKGNDIKTIEGNEGDDLLSLAHEWDVDLEGACEKSLACSTCHVVLDPEIYDKLPEPEDEENDMLDLAFGLEDTSRLGCQVLLTKDLDGMIAKLPSATRNMYVDGAKARTH
ncbi:2Fe-2S ferredoxin-type domain-containing protein [Dioszegia hungarica]|uniref:2Fe-2S ferredoxin-type domain-containing protein n=1 Tax=Dioszegia hungarica TaxID=4972 RepID=A0AA38H622_9TREE|nr:2Fe-2S ferredoxin-type domain-containing protein [Dioszegia hungarica]KAI9634372.1 2Fe-2S ferredoxin-type domain-containing protein [Dioszegia hungarica]